MSPGHRLNSSYVRLAAIALTGGAALFLFLPPLGARSGEPQNPPAAAAPAPADQTAKPGELGYTDTPMIPGQQWRVHDINRPAPRLVTPGPGPGAAPSDAVVLFDGKDLSKWAQRGPNGEVIDSKWPVRDGYFETGAKTGSMSTRDSFGDVQLHVEWAAPPVVAGTSQGRGNSGILLMGRYEVQVLDMYNNRTYPDGGAASLYGQWPPLVSAPRPPGEWQTYDIVFEAPAFDGDKVVKPAFATVFWNGVLAHNRKELLGPTVHRNAPKYVPHPAEQPLTLQDHSNPVRYRNIWIRRLNGYDQGSK
jgi:3-keto-disaccharide hydrolase